jgi:hypothetical protein
MDKMINRRPKADEYKDEFEDVWRLYPRKLGKRKALLHYTKARKSGVSIEEIKAGIERYIRYIEHYEIQPIYIKHPTNWFSMGCWSDEYEELEGNEMNLMEQITENMKERYFAKLDGLNALRETLERLDTKYEEYCFKDEFVAHLITEKINYFNDVSAELQGDLKKMREECFTTEELHEMKLEYHAQNKR